MFFGVLEKTATVHEVSVRIEPNYNMRKDRIELGPAI
jgi:hypothetical protein